MNNQRGTPGAGSWAQPRSDSRLTPFSKKNQFQRPATMGGTPRSRPAFLPSSSLDLGSSSVARPTTAGALNSSLRSGGLGSAPRFGARTGFGGSFGKESSAGLNHVPSFQSGKGEAARKSASPAGAQKTAEKTADAAETNEQEDDRDEGEGSQLCSESESESGDEEPTTLDVLRESILNLQTLPDQLEQDCQYLQESLDKKSEEIAALQERNHHLDEDIERASEALNALESEEQDVRNQYAELDKTFETAKSELAAAKEKIEVMEQDAEESEKHFESEQHACREETALFREKYEAEAATTQKIGLRFEEVQKELTYVQRKIESQLDTIQDLERAKDEQMQEASRLSAANSVLEEQNSSLLAAKSSLELSLTKERTEGKSTREELQGDVESLNEVLRDTKSRLQAEAESKKSLRCLAKFLESKISKISLRLDAVSEVVPLLSVAREQLRSMALSHNAVSSSIVSHANDAQSSTRDSLQSLAEGKRQLLRVCSKLDDITHAHNAAEILNDSLEKSLEDAKQASQSALLNAKASAEREEGLARDRFQKEVSRMEELHRSALKELEAKLAKCARNQTEERQKLSGDYESLVARLKHDHESIVSKFQEKLTDNGNAVLKQEEKLSSKENEILNLRDELENEATKMRAERAMERSKLLGDLERQEEESKVNEGRLLEALDLQKKNEESIVKSQKEITSLRGEIGSQKVALEEKSEEAQVLLKKSLERDQEMNNLRLELGSRQTLLQEVDGNFVESQALLERAKESEIAMQKTIEKLECEIGSQELLQREKASELAEAHDLLKKAAHGQQELHSEIAELQREIVSQAGLLREKEVSLTETRDSLKQCADGQLERNAEIAQLQREIASQAGLLTEKEVSLTETRDSLKQCADGQLERNAEISELQREISSQAGLLREKEVSLAETRDSLKKCEDVQLERSMEIAKLQREVGSKAGLLREKEVSLAETRDSLKKCADGQLEGNAEISRLQRELGSQEVLLRGKEVSLAETRASLKQCADGQLERNAEIAKLQHEIGSQAGHLREKEVSLAESRDSLKQCADEQQERKTEIAKLQRQIESQEVLLREKEVSLTETHDLLTKTDGAGRGATLEINKLRLEIESKGKLLRESVSNLSEAQELLQSRQRENETMQSVAVSKETKILEMQNMIDQQQKEIASMWRDGDVEKAKLLREFEEKKNADLAVSASTRKDLSQMFDRASAAEEKVDLLKCSEDALRKEIESAHSLANAAKAEHEKLLADFEERGKIRDALSETLKATENELRSTRGQQLSSAESHEKQIAFLSTEVEGLRGRILSLQEELDSSKSDAAGTLADLRESAQLYMNTLAEKDALQEDVQRLEKERSSVDKGDSKDPNPSSPSKQTKSNQFDLHSSPSQNDSPDQTLNLASPVEMVSKSNGGKENVNVLEDDPEEERLERTELPCGEGRIDTNIGATLRGKENKNIPTTAAVDQEEPACEEKRVLRSRKKPLASLPTNTTADVPGLAARTPEPGSGLQGARPQGTTKKGGGRLKVTPLAPRKAKKTATFKRPRPSPVPLGSEIDLNRSDDLKQRTVSKPRVKRSKKAAATLLAAASTVADDDDDWIVD